MKSRTILFFTLFYLTTYLGISYLINYFWSLEITFIELLVVGLFFSILLIVLLVFDVPEKIANKIITRKSEVIVYNDNEDVESSIEMEGELVDDFFERTKSMGEGGVKIEENKKGMGELVS